MKIMKFKQHTSNLFSMNISETKPCLGTKRKEISGHKSFTGIDGNQFEKCEASWDALFDLNEKKMQMQSKQLFRFFMRKN